MGTAVVDRTEEITSAAQLLRDSLEAWRDRDQHTDLLDDDFEQAVDSALEIVLRGGDIPSGQVELWKACNALEAFFAAFKNGGEGTRTTTGGPSAQFWHLLEAVFACLEFIEAPGKPRQSVSDLLAELGDFPGRYQQVAKDFGVLQEGKWSGPFFDKTGTADKSLIEKEAKDPGSVLGTWESAADIKRRQAREKAAQSRIKLLESAKNRANSRRVLNDDEMLALLREGQYGDVVATAGGVELPYVIALCEKHGIELPVRESLQSGLHDTEFEQNQSDAHRPLQPATEQTRTTPEAGSETKKSDTADGDDAAAMIAHRTKSILELVAQNEEPSKIAATIRNRKFGGKKMQCTIMDVHRVTKEAKSGDGE